jgi:hypothetical protein
MIITLLLTLAIGTADTIEMNYESKRLFDVINAKRRVDEIPELTLDKGLSYIAYLHCLDLDKYYDKNCSLVSWSKKSGYSYGCVSKDSPDLNVMYNKPKEVLGYEGVGHELICLTDRNITYEMAYTLLRRSQFYSSLLVGANYTRVGVYIHKNIVSVWLM